MKYGGFWRYFPICFCNIFIFKVNCQYISYFPIFCIVFQIWYTPQTNFIGYKICTIHSWININFVVIEHKCILLWGAIDILNNFIQFSYRKYYTIWYQNVTDILLAIISDKTFVRKCLEAEAYTYYTLKYRHTHYFWTFLPHWCRSGICASYECMILFEKSNLIPKDWKRYRSNVFGMENIF